MATPHTAADDLEKGISNVPNSPPIATNDDPINVFSPVTSHSDTQATLTNELLKKCTVTTEPEEQSQLSGCPYWLRRLLRWGEDNKPARSPITRKLEECPAGYPRLAAFLDSDPNFMVFRRFGFLHTRVLLNKQDELRVLEKQLDNIDQEDAREKPKLLKCRERDMRQESTDEKKSRQALLQEIEGKLTEYDKFLIRSQNVVGLSRPAKRDYNSVEIYMNKEKPLVKDELSFIYRKEDCITLRPGRESAWLDAVIERTLKFLECKFGIPTQFLFCSKETRKKSQDRDIVYYTKSRIDMLAAILITIILLVLLVVPVYLLYKLSLKPSSGKNTINATVIGVLIVSTLLFSAILSLFTRAKRHEILGASAAYCAVLVVFIGNIGLDNSSNANHLA